MKKFAVCFSALVCTIGCAAAHANAGFNPFFGDNENQIAFMVAQGFDQGFLIPPPFRIVPFYAAQIQYSQPATFFRLPARQSMNIVTTIGMGKKYGWKWNEYSIPIAMLSEDIPLIYGQNWYLGAGAGVGLQAQQNERLGAKLVFQFKITAGMRFTEHWGGEFYIQHFSNANTAEENNSYAFYGLGMTYSF